MTAEAAQAKREAHVEMLCRLVANDDFTCWLGQALEEFCAFEQGYGQVDDFHQGIRAAGSYMMRTLAQAKGAPEMIAKLYERHFREQGRTEQQEGR